jgi:DNA-binding transcriptional regulator PaaX
MDKEEWFKYLCELADSVDPTSIDIMLKNDQLPASWHGKTIIHVLAEKYDEYLKQQQDQEQEQEQNSTLIMDGQ